MLTPVTRLNSDVASAALEDFGGERQQAAALLAVRVEHRAAEGGLAVPIDGFPIDKHQRILAWAARAAVAAIDPARAFIEGYAQAFAVAVCDWPAAVKTH